MSQIDWWLRYPRSGASSRYRAYQILDRLSDHAHFVHALPQPGRQGRAAVLSAVAARVLRVSLTGVGQSNADVQAVQKELVVPPGLVSSRRVRSFCSVRPTIWDVDDAVWTLSRQHEDQSAAIAQAATRVFAGSSVLAQWCEDNGARDVVVVPTCYDPPLVGHMPDDAWFTAVWVGSPATAKYLGDIGGALRSWLDRCTGTRLWVVGANLPPQLAGCPRAQEIAWSPEAASLAMSAADVGLAPLRRGPFEDGKCGFKIVQYLRHGTLPVASDNATHRELMGEMGILVDGTRRWDEVLEELTTEHPDLQKQRPTIAAYGAAHFSVEKALAVWRRAIECV